MKKTKHLFKTKGYNIPFTSVMMVSFFLMGCNDQSTQPTKPTIPEVGVYTVKEEIIPLTVDLPARTASYRVSQVRPQVDGILEKRLFTEGSDVKKDQPLYQIDKKPYETQVAKAQAAYDNVKKLAARYKSLRATNAISQQEYDDVVSRLDQAKADLNQAKINLGYTQVLSPISGKISRSFVSEGALVSSGQSQPLATITQLDPIYVDITQPITNQLKLKSLIQQGIVTDSEDKMDVTLFLEDGSQYPYSGTLSFSEVQVEPSTGSVTLRAKFPNPHHQLLPGMYTKARIMQGTQEKAILVPQQAITFDARGKSIAFVVDQQQVLQARDVEILKPQGNGWLIKQGLYAGDRIMTEGHHRAKPGVKVNAVPANNVSLKTSLE
ncbi:TPA: efflux RND transporter periplasmic adaptor subunit [Proteus mirabilis]|nr:efflux RND transporter periplasmic adaptor subunit [Proteus mirabilis]HEK0729935.1 efflux RND transporter periplasmic adaptor subunit [Proteus mirabilis]